MRTAFTTITILALAGLLVPAALAVEPTAQNPAKACKAERTADAALFAAAYTTTNGKKPFPACIATKKLQAQALQDATKNAAKACKAERAGDPAAFTANYGTNKNGNGKTTSGNGKNAFGKCVSAKAKELKDEVEAEVRDARVEACKSLMKNQRAEFKQAYKNLPGCIKAQTPSS